MSDSLDTPEPVDDSAAKRRQRQQTVTDQILALRASSLPDEEDLSANAPYPAAVLTKAETRFLDFVSSLLTPNPPGDPEDEITSSYRLKELKNTLIKAVIFELQQDSEESRARCAIRPDVIIAAMLVAKLRAIDPKMDAAEKIFAKDVDTLLDHIVGYSIANQPTPEAQEQKHFDYTSIHNNQMTTFLRQFSDDQCDAIDAQDDGSAYLHPKSLRTDYPVTVRVYGKQLSDELEGAAIKKALKHTIF